MFPGAGLEKQPRGRLRGIKDAFVRVVRLSRRIEARRGFEALQRIVGREFVPLD
jgi:hypothetical protein